VIDGHLQQERGLAEDRQVEDERLRLMSFFEAIAGNDRETLCKMVNEGMDPNAELPVPVPVAFQKQFTDENLRYYLASDSPPLRRRHSPEKGVTFRLTSVTNQCAQKMLLCEVRMKNAFGSGYAGKVVMRLCGQDCLQKPWN
jgi:hypothetical protein